MVGVYLSAENKRHLWIPEDFAHGFYITSEEDEFVYKCTDYYNPKTEDSILWSDLTIGVESPLNGIVPLLSEKDMNGNKLTDVKIITIGC